MKLVFKYIIQFEEKLFKDMLKIDYLNIFYDFIYISFKNYLTNH